MTETSSSDTDLCNCGSDEPFLHCCGPALAQTQPASTAEELMRSRYTAYARRNAEYLLFSWHLESRPDTVEFAPNHEWIDLDILDIEQGNVLDTHGVVEFAATYESGTEIHVLRERSLFNRHHGRWVYVGPEQAELI